MLKDLEKIKELMELANWIIEKSDNIFEKRTEEDEHDTGYYDGIEEMEIAILNKIDELIGG